LGATGDYGVLEQAVSAQFPINPECGTTHTYRA
jgi:hypothetical protein